MSYILAALKKADQERNIGAVPNLATPDEAKPPQTRSFRWLWIILTLVGINIMLVLMLLRDDVADVPVTAQVPVQPQTDLPEGQPVQPVQRTADAPISDRLTSDPLTSEAPAEETPVLPDKEPVRTAGEVVVLTENAYLQDAEASILPEEDPAAQPVVLTASEDYSQMQSLYDLPQEFRNTIDLPRLDVHVYSDDPQKRFIVVNLEKYREGETLASGLKLEEILPDGMLMSYRGERFRVDK